MKKDVFDVELDEYEQEIEDNAEFSVPIEGEELEELEATLDEIRENMSISIRFSLWDIDRVKERAKREGMPYQTLIKSIIHRYLEGTLVDEIAVLQAAKMLNS